MLPRALFFAMIGYICPFINYTERLPAKLWNKPSMIHDFLRATEIIPSTNHGGG
jgi:hypothetical protein